MLLVGLVLGFITSDLFRKPATNLLQQSLGGSVFQSGSAISFDFEYPIGYSALSGVFDNGSESEEYFEKFYLNSGPIWFFPESPDYLFGTVVEASELDFKNKEEAINSYADLRKLPWENPSLDGNCYQYSDGEEGLGMWGKVENNISCVVFIKKNQFSSKGRLFVFEIRNENGAADRKDPERKIAQRFFESLSERTK